MRKSKIIFYNKAQKIRIVWRILIFWGLVLIPLIAWQILFRTVAFILGTTPRSILPVNSYYATIVGSILICFAALFANYYSIKKMQQSNFKDFIGWHFNWHSMKKFIQFFGLGGLIMLIIFLIIIMLKIATVSIHLPNFNIFIPVLLFHLADFLVASLAEETLDRGYIFRILSEKSPLLAIIFTSTIFSIGHISENWASSLSLVNIFIIGCLLGYIYLKTRNLWAIWGFHFGMNVFEGLVFQFPVKGYEKLSGHIFSYRFNVSDVMSGGSAGITGSVLYTAVVIVIFLILIKVYHKREIS